MTMRGISAELPADGRFDPGILSGAEAGTVGLSAHLSGPSGGSGDAAFVLDDTDDVLLSSITFNLGNSYTLAGADITSGSDGPVIQTLDTSLVAGRARG